MDSQPSSILSSIRQQFNHSPYMNMALDSVPTPTSELMYKSHSVTPFYLRNREVISTQDRVILDAGCATGFKSIALARANPGAKVVGVDLSEESIKIAKTRLKGLGHEQVEFYAMPLEELPSLNLTFDYINCDEVLYLLPDPVQGLQAMKTVLKPAGIIRANLHSAMQRVFFYRSQQLFQLMGLMDESPGNLEAKLALETMTELQDWVFLKTQVWKPDYDEAYAHTNYLLVGDKGFTIPDLFTLLQAARLEFISMVDWQTWNLTKLFKDPDNLPMVWAMSLPNLPEEQRLHFYDLLHPAHRLLDFWCGHSGQKTMVSTIETWSGSDWQHGQAHLHPFFQHFSIKAELLNCISNHQLFELSRYVPGLTDRPIALESATAAMLLPLWEAPQPIASLVERSLQLHPVDLETLEPTSPATAWERMKTLLSELESLSYVMLQPSA